ncbi:MAG: hypothetical protein ACLP01_29990 [Solirubrobacteraceae bacterium]
MPTPGGTLAGDAVRPGAISSDGKALLLVRGGFESYADGGTVETVPFGAGSPVHNLAHGAFPDWNL